MNGFGSTDGREVAVALVCEHQSVWVKALQAGSYGRSATVGSFNPVYINIIVGKYGASYRSHANGLVFESHFVDEFGNHAVYHAMRAAGAVVCVAFVEQTGTCIDFIFAFDNFFRSHGAVHFNSGKSCLRASSTSPGLGIIPPMRPK